MKKINQVGSTLFLTFLMLLWLSGASNLLAQVTFSATGLPQGIPDPGSVSKTVTVSGLSGTVATANEVQVNFAVAHSWAGDIKVGITPPGGSEIIIVNSVNLVCSSNSNNSDFVSGNTISIRQNAAGTIPNNSNIVISAGTYLPSGCSPNSPVGSLASLVGATRNGNWTITVYDVEFIISGTLHLASITFFDVEAACTPPSLSISQSANAICEGQTLNLSATDGLSSYSWASSGGTFSSNAATATFSSSSAGGFSFTVTATNSNSCTNTATASVVINSVSAVVSVLPVCAVGNPLNLSASGGDQYAWKGPNGFKSNSATPSKAKTVAKDEGIYSVTVTGNAGCTASSTIRVYYGVGNITATSNSTVCKGGTIQLSATSEFGVSYKWTKLGSPTVYPGQNPTIPNAKVTDGGMYIVFITGSNGCIVKKEVLVTVSSVPCAGPRLASEEVEEIGMEVNAYPNPTSKIMMIEVTLKKPSSLKLQLYNATGQALSNWELGEEATTHRKEVDMSVYKNGLYLIQAESKDGKQTKRVVKVE
jgi:subtilisin-like proprotein convertase family protein